MNLKTATAGTIILTLLFSLIPNPVQAEEFPGDQNPESFGIQFGIDTSVKNTNGTMIGKFPNAIRDFGVFTIDRDEIPRFIFPDTKRESLELEVKLFNGQIDDIKFPAPFKKFSRPIPIYEYSFNVSIYPFSDENSEFLGIERVSWFVPSEFTYEAFDSSLSIGLDDCLFSPVNSLNCLNKIFNKAADNGIKYIDFPTNDPIFEEGDLSTERSISFKTTSIPESNASTSLLALTSLGIVAFLKRKIK